MLDEQLHAAWTPQQHSQRCVLVRHSADTLLAFHWPVVSFKASRAYTSSLYKPCGQVDEASNTLRQLLTLQSPQVSPQVEPSIAYRTRPE